MGQIAGLNPNWSLYKTQQELVHNISVEHTRKILGDRIGLMFYDVRRFTLKLP